MIDVSVIIVNYNVKLFLEQTINSVLGSTGVSTEIIVVDNNSSDDSISYLKERFDNIMFIENDENLGFATACNIGIKKSQGKHILLLNPDTIIEKDTLANCSEYIERHDQIGAIGVAMMDGSGKFLQESKRGLPTPISALWKMIGVSALFPTSSFFNAYNVGHIAENQISEVEVLCGAFMFMPKEVLDIVGGLDEDYFMYGEDIDVSYRIAAAGYKIIYLGDNKIIHFKGQSTKKESVDYVNRFYNAMSIFTKKHYASNNLMLSFFLALGIWVRKSFSIIARLFRVFFPPVLEGCIYFIGFYLLKDWWAEYRFNDYSYYNNSPILLNIISYVSIIILVLFMLRSYSFYKNVKLFCLGVLMSLLLILILYSLFPESARTSRAIILLGVSWVLFAGVIMRLVYSKLNVREPRNHQIGILGSPGEFDRVSKMIETGSSNKVGTISLFKHLPEPGSLLEIIKYYNLNEIVFCLKDISLTSALKLMGEAGDKVKYKVIGDQSLNMVGSSGSNILGESYGLDIAFRLSRQENRYYKRLVDVILSITLLLLSPFLLLSKKYRKNISLKALYSVIINKMTLVGYITGDSELILLPALKPGVIPHTSSSIHSNEHALNTSYALHHTPVKDVIILLNSIF